MGWSGRKTGSVVFAGLRSIWRILFWASLLGVIMMVYDVFLTPTLYQSTAEIYISDAAAGITHTPAKSGSGSAPKAEIADSYSASYIKVMSGNGTLKRIRRKLNSNMQPEQFADYYTVEQIDNTALFRITGTYKDASSALLLTMAAAQSAVKSLQEVGVNASVVDSGTMSQYPIAPNPLRDVLIAFAAGFIIRWIIASICASKDFTLGGRDDWENAFDIPVLSEIPERNDR